MYLSPKTPAKMDFSLKEQKTTLAQWFWALGKIFWAQGSQKLGFWSLDDQYFNVWIKIKEFSQFDF